MTRHEAHATLNAARDGARLGKQAIIRALIATGDMEPANDAGGVRSAEDLRRRCRVDENDCWHWSGAATSSGAPAVWLPQLHMSASLGMVACLLKTGKRQERRTVWRAVCGFSFCANPNHRRPCSRKALAKALAKPLTPLHRAKISATKRQQCGRLTDEQRAEIAESDEPLRIFAHRYSVSIETASRARHGHHLIANGASAFSWRPT